jgi:hypothetical protein
LKSRRRVNSNVGHLLIMDIASWSRMVAALALDRLIDEGFLKREDFDAALGPAAEEIQVRLAMGDYPDIEGGSTAS